MIGNYFEYYDYDTNTYIVTYIQQKNKNDR